MASPCRLLVGPDRMRTESERPILANGTESLSPLIRKCCLRSSWLLTTSTSSPYCPSLSQHTHHRLSFLTLLCSDVGCKTVANMIKGKTPEEIKRLFNIVNDFTPEEDVRGSTCPLNLSDILFAVFQAQIRRENVSNPPCLARTRIGPMISGFSSFRNGLRTARLLPNRVSL